MVENYYSSKKYKANQSIGYLARRTSKLLAGHMDALFATRGMSFVQYFVLINVREKIAVTPSEICQNICHDTGALTRLIDQMEEKGLLTRERSDADRRRVEIHLTPAGEKILDQLVELVVDFWNGVLVDFSKEEADMMTDLLTRVTTKLSSIPKVKAV